MVFEWFGVEYSMKVFVYPGMIVQIALLLDAARHCCYLKIWTCLRSTWLALHHQGEVKGGQRLRFGSGKCQPSARYPDTRGYTRSKYV